MKKLMLIVVFCSIPSLAFAGMEVNVLSADFSATVWVYSDLNQPYSMSKGVPFDYSMFGVDSWGRPDGGAASLGYFSSSVLSGVSGDVAASEDITFQPLSAGTMSVIPVASSWAGYKVSLQDLTTNDIIWSVSTGDPAEAGTGFSGWGLVPTDSYWGTWPGGPIAYHWFSSPNPSAPVPEGTPYIFDPTNVYELTIDMEASGGGDGLWGTSFSTDAIVPEPGTVALVGLGFLGLVAFRKKRNWSTGQL
ncbi:MAG: PEP-CTERM sorting domain-containing protein [Syntrophobacteraceae bacterium]